LSIFTLSEEEEEKMAFAGAVRHVPSYAAVANTTFLFSLPTLLTFTPTQCSWIPGAPSVDGLNFAGVKFAAPTDLGAFAISRDDTGVLSDRLGTVVLQASSQRP
jgi:hypothetical protein